MSSKTENSYLRYKRDLQVASFVAYIQKLLQTQENEFDFLENIQEVANALNIQEPLLTRLVQHQIVVHEASQGENQDNQILLDDKGLWLDQLSSLMQPKEERQFEHICKQFEQAELKKLNLYDAYETFKRYRRQGCTAQQISELRDIFINRMMEYFAK